MASFHFIRPEWLFGLLPAVILWGLLRRRADAAQNWRHLIAPHLLPHLLSGQQSQHRFAPLHLLALTWIVTILAIAGPTWHREPAPFADDTAALAVVIKVTPSMTTEDVQPSRLTRAVQKLHDLLQKRGSGKTALIAYAGSAHVVMPATTDADIIDSFAQSLDPKIMPVEGDDAAAALALADRTLADAGGGSILWITDGMAPEQASSLAAWRKKSSTDLRLLPPLLPGPEFDALQSAARPARASVVPLTADDGDIDALARASKFATVTAAASNTRWAESGYWLTPFILILMLPFFRRGWRVSTGGSQ